jgi:anti-sigma factor RsiW
MAKIIRFLRGDEPHEAQLLLPWYLTGRLEPAERARVEAHLKVCGRCRAELGREQQLEREIGDLAPDVERGWAALASRLDERPGGPLPGWLVGAGQRGRRLWRAGGPWIGWALAASFGALVLAGPLSPRPTATAPERAIYHTLAAPAPAARADALVIFRPSATAQAIAAALHAGGARVTDGPTESGAYLVRIPPGGRALETLRADAAVELAEPIDQASAP